MKITGPQIISELREKLQFEMGRHLYGVLGTYDQLASFERDDLAQAQGPKGRPFPKPVNLNREILATLAVMAEQLGPDIQVQQDKGLPVILNFPEEGTSFEIGGISVIEGAKNEAAAQAWVDYVFSEAFQRYHNDVAHRLPVVPGVALAEGSVGLDDVKLIEGYDPTEWAAKRDDLVARWQEEIGATR